MQYFLSMIFLVISWFLLQQRNAIEIIKEKYWINKKDIKQYTKEYYAYSRPLVIYFVIVLIVGVGERWYLQVVGGAQQQGFFSLGYKISMVVGLITASLNPLFTREFSIAWADNNRKKMEKLVTDFVPLIYLFSSIPTIFTLININELFTFFGGTEFENAIIPVSILILAPIHQAIGQLIGSIYYATDFTNLYKNINIVSMLFGIVITIILLSPESMGGLNMGATGLSIKLVTAQIISVNILFMGIVRKIITVNNFDFIKIQVMITAVIIFSALLSKGLIGLLSWGVIPTNLANIVLYSIFNFLIFYYKPQVFGIKRQVRNKLFETLFSRIKTKG